MGSSSINVFAPTPQSQPHNWQKVTYHNVHNLS